MNVPTPSRLTRRYFIRSTVLAAFTAVVALTIADPAFALPPDDTLYFSADTPYVSAAGEVWGSGEVYIYNSEKRAGAPIDQPIVVIDGFDYGNQKKAEELYVDFNQAGLFEAGREQGYDFILVNPDDGANYIQANAMLLKKVIQHVNSVKQGGEQIVVIGPSMGGLIARYALLDMENRGQQHGVRLFVAFDTPNRGANIPIGNQYFLRFFAEYSNSAKTGRNKIESVAAQQMLVHHNLFGGHSPLYSQLFAELQAMGGYPKQLRKIAMANGSAHGVGQGFGPGAQLLEYNVKDSWYECPNEERGNVWAGGPGVQVFFGKIACARNVVKDERMWVGSNYLPYDGAPGGMYDTTLQIDQGKGVVHALHPYHAFIPTVSALDIDTADLFHNIANDPNIRSKSPYDKIYFPGTGNNEFHGTISAEKRDQLLGEINSGRFTWLPAILDVLLN